MGRNNPTASPRFTPSSRSAFARRFVSAASSPYVARSTVPSSLSHTTAGRSAGWRSTQLWVRFTVPPVNQVAQAVPAEVSSTRSYGWKNSIPRKRTAASQNHSMSSRLRSISSRQPSMPCSRMNAVACACSSASAVGSQM